MKKKLVLVLVIVILFSGVVYADISIFAELSYKANENNLRIQSFTSMYNTDVANNYSAWNPYSSNVEITSFTYNPSNNFNYEIRVNDYYLVGTVNGYTAFWKDGSKQSSGNRDNLDYATVNINRYRITSGTAKASRVMLHELGHVLGLDHPDTSCTDKAIMVQSKYSNAAYIITSHDIANFEAKWGK